MKVKTAIVNNSTNITKTNNHLSHLHTEHKKDHDIWPWKSRSWFGIGTKSGRIMVLNATFNNISVISCRSVWLVKETGVPGEIYRPDVSHWQTLSHLASPWAGFELTTLVVIGTSTDCMGSCKSKHAKDLARFFSNTLCIIYLFYLQIKASGTSIQKE